MKSGLEGMSEVRSFEDVATEYMRRIGWSELTPIQGKALPVILRGKHTLLVAPTGSGKTEAAVIPIFTLLADGGLLKRGVRMLYITPLRALNRDIFRRIIKYAEDMGLKTDVRHGDTPQVARQRMVAEPPDVLVTTPETLAIMLTSRRMRENLKAVEWVVVDELHELIGSKRGAHLSVSLERLVALAGREVVRVGLSATLEDLGEAGRFLSGVGRRIAVLVDPSVRRYDISLHHVDGSLTDVADYILEYVRGRRGVEVGRGVILFTNTRDEAEYIAVVLKAKSPDVPIEVHHGSLSREIREEAESRLRTGEAGMVVSTSSLELGLDIGAVDLVVQCGSSRQAVKLIQRIGRSRHRVGEAAVGHVVTQRLDDELEALALINRIRRGGLEKSRIHEKALDVLAHHLVGMVIERGSVRIEEALKVIRCAYPFRGAVLGDVDSCLQLLERQGVVRYDGEAVRGRGEATYRYYYENISTIPDIQQFTVTDLSSNRRVGALDQIFVGEYGEVGRYFVLKGSSWRIVSIDDEGGVVYVEPVHGEVSTVPYWVGELIPVEFETAWEVGRLRRIIASGGKVEVSEGQRRRIDKSGEILGCTPGEGCIVVEKRVDGDAIILHACFGSRVNQTLATMLSTVISSRIGYLVEARSDPYRILLSSQGRLLTSHVTEFLHGEYVVEDILSVAVVGTHPLNWKIWYVAKRFGVVGKDAQYDRRASRLIQDRYSGTALYREVLRELFFEKYDVEGVKRVISEVKSGRIGVYEREVEKFSPLAQPILQHASSFSALPLTVDKTILEMVKERLENSKHRLVCLSCGRWESVVKTREVKEPFDCPICRSRLIADTYVSDDGLVRLIQKRKRGQKLSKDEEKIFRRAWKTSSLIQAFGRKAVITLSGFGIGADTAARILRRDSDEDEFYRDIYRAEKTFISTRGFWRDAA